MSARGPAGEGLRALARTAADALVYSVLVTVLAFVGSGVLAVATGGGPVRAKWLLFIVGWILLALATVRLWPRSPNEADRWTRSAPGGGVPVGRRQSRLERAAGRLPPLRWARQPVRRLSPAAKQFLAAVLVLLASFLIEAVFAVG